MPNEMSENYLKVIIAQLGLNEFPFLSGLRLWGSIVKILFDSIFSFAKILPLTAKTRLLARSLKSS